jgi:hypothetical protein
MSVMVVMSVTFPHTYRGFLHDGELMGCLGDRYAIVTVIVTERMAYPSGLLARVTAMTLMTVICGCFLSAGLRLDSPRRFQGGRAIPFIRR